MNREIKARFIYLSNAAHRIHGSQDLTQYIYSFINFLFFFLFSRKLHQANWLMDSCERKKKLSKLIATKIIIHSKISDESIWRCKRNVSLYFRKNLCVYAAMNKNAKKKKKRSQAPTNAAAAAAVVIAIVNELRFSLSLRYMSDERFLLLLLSFVNSFIHLVAANWI